MCCSKGMVLRQLVFWIHPYGVRCVAQASDLGSGRQQYHQRCHARWSLQEGNGRLECRLRRSRWYGCLRMLHMLHGTLSSGEPSHLRLKSTPSDPGRYSEALTEMTICLEIEVTTSSAMIFMNYFLLILNFLILFQQIRH